MIQHVLFDLDGTLTDSADGITRCLHHALISVGGEAPPTAELRAFIGAPLSEIFSALLDTDDKVRVDAAISHYRERFDRVGYAENRVYDGITEVLAQLRVRGYALYVATAKAQRDATRIIDHFELGDSFHAVFGVNGDAERLDKSVLMRRIVKTHGLQPEAVAMVGDRVHDVLGAQRAGIRAIGAGWGYGSAQELRDSAAIASSPAELLDHLPHRAGRERIRRR